MDKFSSYQREIDEYYADNCKKLHNLVDYLLRNYIWISDSDKEEFYSMASEIFVKALRDFDPNKAQFNTHLQNCLERKFISEFRDRRASVRCLNYTRNFGGVDVVSIDETILDDGESKTIGDTICSDFCIEDEIDELMESEMTSKAERYLRSISPVQRKIACMLLDGETPEYICNKLGITIKKYNDHMKQMRSFRNKLILISDRY